MHKQDRRLKIKWTWTEAAEKRQRQREKKIIWQIIGEGCNHRWQQIESVMDAKTEAWIKVEARQCKLFARCPALDLKGQNVGYFSWIPWHLKLPEIPAPS